MQGPATGLQLEQLQQPCALRGGRGRAQRLVPVNQHYPGGRPRMALPTRRRRRSGTRGPRARPQRSGASLSACVAENSPCFLEAVTGTGPTQSCRSSKAAGPRRSGLGGGGRTRCTRAAGERYPEGEGSDPPGVPSALGGGTDEPSEQPPSRECPHQGPDARVTGPMFSVDLASTLPLDAAQRSRRPPRAPRPRGMRPPAGPRDACPERTARQPDPPLLLLSAVVVSSPRKCPVPPHGPAGQTTTTADNNNNATGPPGPS